MTLVEQKLVQYFILQLLKMVLGKAGLRLEAWKFAVYITVPIFASVVYNEPELQRVCADYFQFMKYPANPNTNLREEFEELSKKRALERESRKEHAEMVRQMHEAAKKSREKREAAIVAEGERQRSGWFRWLRSSR